MSVETRVATKEDEVAIAGIFSDWKAAVEWMPSLHSREADLSYLSFLVSQEQVQIALEDNVIQGFMAQSGGMVNFLYLASAARRRGIGTKLLDVAKEQAEAGLQLWCFQQNPGAVAFYKANGFGEVMRTDGAENEEKLPDVLLSWGMPD